MEHKLTKEEAIKWLEAIHNMIMPEQAHQALNMAIDALRQPASSIEETMERPTGRWIEVRKDDWSSDFECSVCGRRVIISTTPYTAGTLIRNHPYCHCGAKMTE